VKKSILLLTAILFIFPLSVTTFAGIPGTPDNTPAATLVVPFFEVSKSGVQDTLLVVTNTYGGGNVIIHYEIWDIDGILADVYGNVTLGPDDSWSISMKTLIAAASAAAKSQLTDGDYYRGFVTIDEVTSATDDWPTLSTYPFDNYNDLDGYIYYVRLAEGSSNGLNMIPIEYVGSSIDYLLRDFYQIDDFDGREEITSDSRACAEALVYGESCPYSDDMYEIHSRVFLNPSLSAKSRIILFVWTPWWEDGGGPSDICDYYGDCATSYTYRRYDESGNLLQNTSISLHHVVNVINVSGTQNGWVDIWDVPSGINDGQIFAFSFNSASSSSASTNWDAIFVSDMIPDYYYAVMSGAARRSPSHGVSKTSVPAGRRHGDRGSRSFAQP
jgi:hypothetical protein